MRALLLADWYTSKRFLWLYVLLVLVFMTGAVSCDTVTGLCLALCASSVASTVPFQTLMDNVLSRWNWYAQILPCTRGQMISAKYLEGLACTGTVWIYGTLLFCVKAALGGWPWSGALMASAGVMTVGLLGAGLCLAAAFRFGLMKSRFVYGFIISVSGLSGSFISIFGGGGAPLEDLHAGLWVLLLPMAAVFFGVCWLLSVRRYRDLKL